MSSKGGAMDSGKVRQWTALMGQYKAAPMGQWKAAVGTAQQQDWTMDSNKWGNGQH